MSPATLAEYLTVARKAGLMQLHLETAEFKLTAVLGPDAEPTGDPIGDTEPGGWKRAQRAIEDLDAAFESDEDPTR